MKSYKTGEICTPIVQAKQTCNNKLTKIAFQCPLPGKYLQSFKSVSVFQHPSWGVPLQADAVGVLD